MPEVPAPTSASFWRNHLVQISYAAFGLVLFVGFLFATFPYSATLSKVLAPMGFEFSSVSQTLRFPFGAELTGVRVNSMTSANPNLQCPVITIAPSLLSLLIFHPGVRVNASIYDGQAVVTLRPSSGGTAISYNLEALNIARQQLLSLGSAAASGTVSGYGKLWLSPADLDADTGDGVLSGTGLTISSPLTSGPIRLGIADAKFKLDRGTLTIDGLKTRGGDLTLTASGTIHLAGDPSQSALAIAFNLVAEPAAISRFGVLFALLPHPPSAEPYRLSGTLSAPQIL